MVHGEKIDVEYNKWADKENKEEAKGRVSYSQFSLWKTCPQSWKLKYIAKQPFEPSIHMTFGTSMHETLQYYIYKSHTESAQEADKLNLEHILKERMEYNYTETVSNGEHFSNPDEMAEFYLDGVAIIDWLKKHRSEFFKLQGYELIGIELPINIPVFDDYDINLIGYLDLVFLEKSTNTIFIIDIKTSTSGWKKYQKDDKTKTAQLVLYKKYFSEQYNHPLDKIKVSYHIIKRKVPKDPEYKVMLRRLQKFEPTNGSVTINRLMKDFREFIEDTHDKEGNRLLDKEYKAISNNGKNCKWCTFKDKHDLCDPKKRI